MGVTTNKLYHFQSEESSLDPRRAEASIPAYQATSFNVHIPGAHQGRRVWPWLYQRSKTSGNHTGYLNASASTRTQQAGPATVADALGRGPQSVCSSLISLETTTAQVRHEVAEALKLEEDSIQHRKRWHRKEQNPSSTYARSVTTGTNLR